MILSLHGIVDSESTYTYGIVDSESTYTYAIVDSESTYRHGMDMDMDMDIWDIWIDAMYDFFSKGILALVCENSQVDVW